MFDSTNFDIEAFSPLAWWLNEDEEVEPPPVSVKWGYGPMIYPKIKDPKKSKKRRQNEALLMLLM